MSVLLLSTYRLLPLPSNAWETDFSFLLLQRCTSALANAEQLRYSDVKIHNARAHANKWKKEPKAKKNKKEKFFQMHCMGDERNKRCVTAQKPENSPYRTTKQGEGGEANAPLVLDSPKSRCTRTGPAGSWHHSRQPSFTHPRTPQGGGSHDRIFHTRQDQNLMVTGEKDPEIHGTHTHTPTRANYAC